MPPPSSPSRKAVIGFTVVITLIGIALFQAEFADPYPRLLPLGVLIIIVVSFVALERKYRNELNRQQEKIERLMGLKVVLASLIDMKDPYTEGHSRNVRDLTFEFSNFLDLPPEACEEHATAAELHDIGKIGLPDAILKKAGSLQDEEYTEVKVHPRLGAEALKTLRGFESIRNIILHHHERYDGTGYPDGLAGDCIPLGSRIIALADSYDAMLHGREYRAPMSIKEIISALQAQAGKQFDPDLTSAFLKFLQHGVRSGTRDPVCGMPVSAEDSDFVLEKDGHKWLFCSETCMQEFQRHPPKYLLKPEAQHSDSKN